MSFLRSLWRGYLGLLDRHPLTTKCTTSGLIMMAGDAIQQGIEYRTKQTEWTTTPAAAAGAHSKAAESKPVPNAPSFIDSYDVPRSIRSGIFGAFAVGPIFHVWFSRLDRFIPGSGLKPVAAKMLIDQGFMAPVFTTFYFATMGLMEGKNTQQIQQKIETAIWPTLVANWCIFPFSQAINFAFVPQHLRVLVLNAGGLVYNVYLSRYNAEPTAATATTTESVPPTSPALVKAV